MNTALKNRLVGTVIVVALAVIFLPEYLDGQKRVREDIKVQIPPTPEVEPFRGEVTVSSDVIIEQATYTPEVQNDSPIDAAEQTESNQKSSDTEDSVVDVMPSTNSQTALSQNSSTQPSTTPDESMVVAEVDESLAQQTLLTKQQQDGAGWVIQLGSFKHQKNVRELVRKVEKAGYRTFTRPIQTPAGKLTKVFVGPEINKPKLDEALPHLKELTGLAGRITPFEIK